MAGIVVAGGVESMSRVPLGTDRGPWACDPETAFDTLVLKAALFAIEKYFLDKKIRLPVMASVTIFQGGRTLSGQTVEAFWTSISHANLMSVGFNAR